MGVAHYLHVWAHVYIIAGITDMSKIFQRLYLNPLWGTEALPTLLTLRSSLSTTPPLSRRHLPKPQPPGLGYNRSELIYKQHKHYKEIFKSKEREGGGIGGRLGNRFRSLYIITPPTKYPLNRYYLNARRNVRHLFLLLFREIKWEADLGRPRTQS